MGTEETYVVVDSVMRDEGITEVEVKSDGVEKTVPDDDTVLKADGDKVDLAEMVVAADAVTPLKEGEAELMAVAVMAALDEDEADCDEEMIEVAVSEGNVVVVAVADSHEDTLLVPMGLRDCSALDEAATLCVSTEADGDDVELREANDERDDDGEAEADLEEEVDIESCAVRLADAVPDLSADELALSEMGTDRVCGADGDAGFVPIVDSLWATDTVDTTVESTVKEEVAL